MSRKGLFIVLEGIDGSGKTTLRNGIRDALVSAGTEVVVTEEPTDGIVGSILRGGGVDNNYAESLLFVADRACHTDRMVRDLERGATVICDRYYASTLAYQSAGSGGIDHDLLVRMNESAIVEPDLTFLLDIDPERSMSRVAGRGEERSKFERLEFQRKVRENYLAIARERGFVILDASDSKERLLEESLTHIINKQR